MNSAKELANAMIITGKNINAYDLHVLYTVTVNIIHVRVIISRPKKSIETNCMQLV